MNMLSYTDLRTHLADLLNRIKYQGERIIVGRRGEPIAALISLEDLKRLEKYEDILDAQLADAAVDDETMSWKEYKRLSDARD